MSKQIIGRKHLTLKERISLSDFMRTRYTESGLDNVQFSGLVQKELGITVSSRVIMDMVGALELPPNKPRGQSPAKVIDRIAALEKEVSIIRAKLADLLKD